MKYNLFVYPFLFFFTWIGMEARSQTDTIAGDYSVSLDNEIVLEEDSFHSADSIARFFLSYRPDYEWVSYRMKIRMEQDNKKRDFQLFLVNRIDSILYINLHISGIELARLVVTPDQVTFVNKLQYEYYRGGYELFSRMLGFPADFYTLQSLFNGIDFYHYENNFFVSDQLSDVQLISPRRCDTLREGVTACLMQEIVLNNAARIKQNTLMVPHTGHSLRMTYEDYTGMEYGDFFTKMAIEIPSAQIYLKADLKSVKFNKPGPTTIRIPDSFTPMEIPVINY